jgi:hypothetical protein
MRAIQGSFGRLQLPLDANDTQGHYRILNVCMHLHQLRVQCVGINQIKNVYQPIWAEAEGDDLWTFETMVFGEIRQ